MTGPVEAATVQQNTNVDEIVVNLPEQIDGTPTAEWMLRIHFTRLSGGVDMSDWLPLVEGAITCPMTLTTTSEAGSVQIVVEGRKTVGDATLVWASGPSWYRVLPSERGGTLIPVQTPDWIDQLNAALADALAAAETLQAAETAEGSRIAAEALRLSAETARIAAENIRAENDAARAQLLADAQTAAQSASQALSDTLALMGQPGGVATLGMDGKLPASQLSSLALIRTVTVADRAAMLALTADDVQQGDGVQVLADDDGYTRLYQLQAGGDPSAYTDWLALNTPNMFVAEAGHAQTATAAEDATKINGKRLVSMTQSQYDTALASGTLDDESYYVVVPDAS